MNIPGSNLVNLALSVIGGQTVSYYKFTGRTTNTRGLYVPEFADPIDVVGSFQPDPRELVQLMGLDANKTYAAFYTSRTDVLDVGRDRTGDEFTYAGRKYRVLGTTPWEAVDGWAGVMAVDIGAE